VDTHLRFRVAFAAVLALWLALRLLYWNGYYTEDAPGYVTDAIWAALGQYHARDYVNGLNVGTYLPVALPLWLFGKSEAALSVWPLACSLLGLLSLSAMCRLLLGPSCGVLAGLLYATYPGDVFFSTVVMPDALQAGWLSFSMYLVARACVRESPLRRFTLAGAGIAVGVCHLIRANDVLLLPAGVAAVAVLSCWWERRRLADVAADCTVYLAGWLSVNVLEGLAYLWATGDFVHRFTVINQHYGTLDSIARAGLNTSLRTIPFSLFPVLEWWTAGNWGHLNQDQAYHGLLFVWAVVALPIATVAVGMAARRGDRRALAILGVGGVWLLWPLFYHQFGSQSLTHFVPVHRLSRHFVVYAPGAIFAAVAGCGLLARSVRGGARTAVMVAGAAMLMLHLTVNLRGEQIAYGAFHRIKDTYVRIHQHLPGNVTEIAADPGDLCFLDFWMNPLGSERTRMVPFAAYASCADIHDAVVITRSNPGWEGLNAPVIQETVGRLPCLVDVPARWQLLYDGYPEKVFQAGPR
jgi:hypothetical protein